MYRLIFLFITLVVILGSTDFCYGCGFTVPLAAETMDDIHIEWCSNSTHRDNLWNCLDLDEEEDFWQDQLAVDGPWCSNPYGATTRLFNALWFIGGVQWNRSNITLNQPTSDWYNFVCINSTGYYNTCENTRIATNYNPGSTVLRPQFYIRSVPGRASTLIHEAKHEEVSHCCSQDGCEDYCKDEIGDAATCGNSMDWSYGLNNATTPQVRFLMEAMGTFQKDAATNELIIVEDPNSGECGYVRLVSEHAYNNAKDIAIGKLDSCFIFTPAHPERASLIGEIDFPHSWGTMMSWYPSYPWAFGDYWSNAKWPCEEICEVTDHIWPGGELACNEDYNDQNLGINSWNRTTCSIIKASVADGAPLSEIHAAQQQWLAQKKLCDCWISEDYLQDYCSDLMTQASSVSEIEESWAILDNEPCAWFPYDAINDCIKLYCQEEFDQAWINDAREMCYEWDDPLGCLDKLCGPLQEYDEESMGWFFESLQCRRHFIEHNGDVDAYFDEFENMCKCDLMYTHCKNGKAMEEWWEAKQNGECILTPELGQSSMYQVHILNFLDDINYDISYSSLVQDYASPGKCESLRKLCEKISELNSKLAAKFLAVSESPIPLPEDPWINQIKTIDIGMHQLAEYIAAPILAYTVTATDPTDNISGFTQEEAIHQLTHTPEYLHALSKALGKDAFFALFGGKGFEKVYGETIASHHTTADIQFGFELTPEQELLVPEFNLHKETRERIESSETLELMESIANADPERLFNFMQDVFSAPNIEELNMLLDELQLGM